MDLRLGIDIACRTAHQASLADHTGRLLWRGHRFHTITGELDRLWRRLPEGTDPTQVMVIMEPPATPGCRWRPGSAGVAPA